MSSYDLFFKRCHLASGITGCPRILAVDPFNVGAKAAETRVEVCHVSNISEVGLGGRVHESSGDEKAVVPGEYSNRQYGGAVHHFGLSYANGHAFGRRKSVLGIL